eukprot:751626-Hanusia_phi.AAC.3
MEEGRRRLSRGVYETMSPMKMQGINSKMATTMPSRSNRRDDGGSEEKEEEEKLVERRSSTRRERGQRLGRLRTCLCRSFSSLTGRGSQSLIPASQQTQRCNERQQQTFVSSIFVTLGGRAVDTINFSLELYRVFLLLVTNSLFPKTSRSPPSLTLQHLPSLQAVFVLAAFQPLHTGVGNVRHP